jgi:hypothetical protein
MKLKKEGRKWVIQGDVNEDDNKGWIFRKKFPTKWKAEIAINVFKEGGRVSDYWEKVRKISNERPKRIPNKAIEKVEKSLLEIGLMDPTCEEIIEYAEIAGYGTVTITDNENYFPPRLDNTYGKKFGGRVHIDVGCGGYHLMLDQYKSKNFIDFIKNKRTSIKKPYTVNL